MGSVVLLLVILGPFFSYLVWGLVLIISDDIEYHIGFAIGCLLISAHLLLLSVMNWWVRKWRVTLLPFIGGICSVIFLFGYIFSVLYIPKHFSYTGTTMTYMTLTFIFVSIAHFEIDFLRKRVAMTDLTREMEKTAPKSEKEDVIEIDQVVKKIRAGRKFGSFAVIGICVGLYTVAFGVYSVTIAVNDSWSDKEDKNHLGWLNSLIIGVTDTLLVLWGALSKRGISLSPFKSSVFLLITRVIISF